MRDTVLDSRVLSWLGECGACKFNILRALAEGSGANEERLQGALKRLQAAGRIEAFRQRGGLHYRQRA